MTTHPIKTVSIQALETAIAKAIEATTGIAPQKVRILSSEFDAGANGPETYARIHLITSIDTGYFDNDFMR